MTKKDITYVTKPKLPPLNDFIAYLEKIWESKQLTNNGQYLKKFEKKLSDFLNVRNCSVLSNGTLALLIGIKSLNLTGEVITTPFSFVATTHAIHWNGLKPVFCDIEEETCNINPEKIESLINKKTTAILPVHVYGNPCNVKKIEEISLKYGLKVIYDSAHAFHTKIEGESILNNGDMSILSFHATKAFNTLEGGAIVTNEKEIKDKVNLLRNFGFVDEVTVIEPGINAKMDEVRAAYGLLELNLINREIEKRKRNTDFYKDNLKNIKGVKFLKKTKGVTHSYQYLPILIDENEYGKSRDDVYELLKKRNIFPRRYFYPLISKFSPYNLLDSASPKNLPVAEKIAQQVLCLPMYGDLKKEKIDEICNIIKQKTE
jgi:dTDP-4-amino-4,6-dideoxygalactose transaminase